MKKYEKYKDSGIEWIGEIPKGWVITKLKYFISIQSGIGIENKELDPDGKFPVYGGNGIMGHTNKSNSNEEVLIIGRVGALCGNVHLIKGEIWISDNALWATSQQNKTFISYYLKFLDLNRLANKNAQPLITGSLVKDQFVSLPSLSEQTSIATFLDYKTLQLDTLIDKKEQLIEKLKAQRKAIINEVVTKGLNPDAAMKESGIEWLGKIPENWEVKDAKYLLAEKDGIKIGPFGSALKLDTLSESGIKIYGQGNVIKDDFTLGERYLTYEQFETDFKQYEILDGDILITMMGTTGKSKVFSNSFERGILDSHLLRLRFNEAKFSGKLFSIILEQSDYISQQVIMKSRGSIMAGLNSSIIKELKIIVPPIEEQNFILNYIESVSSHIDKIISKVELAIEKLKLYRQSLISEAVTGKIDVRDWEKPELRIN